MKLTIKEYGDPSVGIPERYYEIDCPFEKDEVSELDLILFKRAILNNFNEYCEMKLDGFYDYEYKDFNP